MFHAQTAAAQGKLSAAGLHKKLASLDVKLRARQECLVRRRARTIDALGLAGCYETCGAFVTFEWQVRSRGACTHAR